MGDSYRWTTPTGMFGEPLADGTVGFRIEYVRTILDFSLQPKYWTEDGPVLVTDNDM